MMGDGRDGLRGVTGLMDLTGLLKVMVLAVGLVGFGGVRDSFGDGFCGVWRWV